MSIHCLSWVRCLRWCLVALACAMAPSAWAVAYVFGTTAFNSTFPSGCSGLAGAYTCTSAVTLNAADTVTFSVKPSIVTFSSGTLNVNGAKINASGAAADLTLSFISGASLSATAGAKINGNVSVSSNGTVSSSGAATFGGNITTATGSISLAASSTVAGTLTSTSGGITLSGTNTVGGGISCSCTVQVYSGSSIGGALSATLMNGADGASTFGGSVSTTSGSATIGAGSTVNGNVKSNSSDVVVLVGAAITGNVSSGATASVYNGVRITGTTNAVYVNNGAGSATFGGTVTGTTGGVYLGTTSTVTGNVSSTSGTITLAGTNSVSGNINCSCTVQVYRASSIGSTLSATLLDSADGASSFGGNINTTSGYAIIGSGSTVYGSVTSTGGNVDIRPNATINGSVSSGAWVYVYNGVSITGTTSGVYVDNDLGPSTFGGAITSTTGWVSIGPGSTVAGSITSAGDFVVVYGSAIVNGNITNTGGSIDLRSAVKVYGAVTATNVVYIYGGVSITRDVKGLYVNNDSGTATLGGNVSATTGYLSVGHDTTVAGSLSTTTGTIYLYDRSSISGGISCDCYLLAYSYVTVGGGVNVNLFDNGAGNYSTFNASVRALSGTLVLGNYGVIAGDAIGSDDDIYLYPNSRVGKCSRTRASVDHIFLYNGSSSGAVCCGTGSSCDTSCVSNGSGASMPPTCATLPDPMAEYLFNQASWNGTTGEVRDTSGNGWHATAASLSSTKPTTTTTSPAIAGSPGTCAYPALTRANKDYVALPQGFPHLGEGGDFTVTAWIKSTDVTLSSQRIFADDEAGTSSGKVGFALSLGDPGAGRLRFYTRATSTANLDTPLGLANNTWYFVAFGVDAINQKKYIYVYNASGGLVTSASASYTLSSGTDLGGDLGMVSVGAETNAATSENTSSFGFSGNIDELRVYPTMLSTADLALVRAKVNGCSSTLDHVEIQHSTGQGLTCTPSTFTVRACGNAACTSLYTGGVTGSLKAGATTVGSINITAGNSSTSISTQITTPGNVLMSVSGQSTTCNFGNPSCTFTVAESGLVMSLDQANHVAETTRTLTIQAVKKSDTSTSCAPAFQGSRDVTFSCAYDNPVLGTKAVALTNSAPATVSLSCGTTSAQGAGQKLALSFDATGTATATMLYPDVGKVTLSGTYAGSAGNGDTGLSMAGTTSFIAAPASFSVSATAGPIKAGDDFSATITAKTAADNAAPNFGQESASAGGATYSTAPETAEMAWARHSPTGTGSSDGQFSVGSLGSFSGGVATSTGMSWTEVGTGTLTAKLKSGNYLGTGLTATGSTNAGDVGAFVPHHYQVDVNNGCGTQFTYSGQPFGVVVTALNKTGGTTVNNDGSGTLSAITATDIELSAVSNGATVDQANVTINKSKFSLGKATVAAAATSPTFTFKSKPYLPTSVTVRATDANGTSSSGYTEGAVNLRFGRIKVSNKFGSAATSLDVPVQTQYWKDVSSGSGAATWVVNSQDSCTVVPASAVVLGGYLDRTGTNATAWPATASSVSVSSGNGVLTLTKPSAAIGSVDFALALGTASTDQSCLNPSRSISSSNTGAGLLWLRSQYGSTYGCSGNAAYDRDPSARATFGVFAPETQKAVHVRDIF